ncbi:MAG: hypothetical protein LUH11_03265 [Candidatus Gastranaerophilales bacterium]|nr:hypothetical protein [Candidatus Gastranaerophilales bacterium]
MEIKIQQRDENYNIQSNNTPKTRNVNLEQKPDEVVLSTSKQKPKLKQNAAKILIALGIITAAAAFIKESNSKH